MQKVLKTRKITVLADKDYYKSEDVKALEDAGTIALVPKSDTSGAEKKAYLIVHYSDMTRLKMFTSVLLIMNCNIAVIPRKLAQEESYACTLIA